MAQIVVEKKKNPVEGWYERHKKGINTVVGCAGLFVGGYMLGSFTKEWTANMGLEIARGDGFLKLLNPTTGESCDSVTWLKLIKEHYDL